MHNCRYDRSSSCACTAKRCWWQGKNKRPKAGNIGKKSQRSSYCRVVEHPDYTTKQCTRDVIEWVQDVYGILLPKNLTEKNSVVVVHDLGMVDLAANFPASDGWYPVDEKHGIPIVGSSADRYLLRVDSRVGPVARGVIYYWDFYRGGEVDLGSWPSGCLGAAVEAPADAPGKLRLKPPQTRRKN